MVNNTVNMLSSDINTFRSMSRGRYDTDFSFLNYDSQFPSPEVKDRQSVYLFREKQYTGMYAENKQLLAFINNVETKIPYNIISLNFFELITNKMTDLIFNNDITIKTGDIKRDKKITKLVERLNWVDGIRKAFTLATVYGDACIKTYKDGISAFSPMTCFKVVDVHDMDKVKGYVMYEPIYIKVGNNSRLEYIRFEIHFAGKIYECVKRYIGNGFSGTIGDSVEIKYNNRIISANGNWYDTGIDDRACVQWLSINTVADGVYGQSIYQNIQAIVFAMEQRLSVTNATLNNLAQPLLVIGQSCLIQNEQTGEYELKIINGKYLVTDDRSGVADGKNVLPQQFDADYKLDSSNDMMELLRSFLYELSEMSKSYLSGEYSGQISEETFTNTIKSAIDKGNRYITELYSGFRDSLYCLCRLNNIDVDISDITIMFNIGRTDDDLKVAQICREFINSGMYSKKTLREKYSGYNSEQSDEEDNQIKKENSSITESNQLVIKNSNNVDKDKKKENEESNIKSKEDVANETK